MIRHAQAADLAKIDQIYASARQFMKEQGNPTQWGDSYPPRENITRALERDELYVLDVNGEACAVFVFWTDRPEPTYAKIYEGAWHYDLPYGVMHHLASDGSCPGVFRAAFDYVYQFVPYMRIDTHADNRPLRTLAKTYGFQYCGKIQVEDGSWRLAYDMKTDMI